MRKLSLFVSAFGVALLANGCGGTDYDGMHREDIANVEEVTSALAKVQDMASAEDAMSAVKKYTGKQLEFMKAFRKLPDAKKIEFGQKYEAEMDRVGKKFREQVERIEKIDGAKDLIAELKKADMQSLEIMGR